MKKYLLALLLLGCSDSKKIGDIQYSFADNGTSFSEILKLVSKPCLKATGKKCVSVVMKKGGIAPLTYPINEWQTEQILSIHVFDPNREIKFYGGDNCQAIKAASNCLTTEKLNEALQPYLKAP